MISELLQNESEKERERDKEITGKHWRPFNRREQKHQAQKVCLDHWRLKGQQIHTEQERRI